MKWIKSFHLRHVVIELIMERNIENPKSHPALFQTQCLTRPQGHNYKARIQRLQLDSTHPLSLLDKTLEQMLPSDRNAVRKCRQLVLFLCTIFKKQCFFKFSNTQRMPYTRVVCSVFTKICLGIIRKGDNTFWCNVLS